MTGVATLTLGRGYSGGVGAYNDDGTLKANTVVVTVDDATKNTVTATLRR
jgi:hypothetical protein